jgi:PAS domain S-box-containing protein
MPELIMEAARPTAEALLEAMSDAVYAVDAERRITYWNSAAERLTGYRAAEAVGRYCHDNLRPRLSERAHPGTGQPGQPGRPGAHW